MCVRLHGWAAVKQRPWAAEHESLRKNAAAASPPAAVAATAAAKGQACRSAEDTSHSPHSAEVNRIG